LLLFVAAFLECHKSSAFTQFKSSCHPSARTQHDASRPPPHHTHNNNQQTSAAKKKALQRLDKDVRSQSMALQATRVKIGIATGASMLGGMWFINRRYRGVPVAKVCAVVLCCLCLGGGGG
jgi:hypothetical protein